MPLLASAGVITSRESSSASIGVITDRESSHPSLNHCW